MVLLPLLVLLEVVFNGGVKLPDLNDDREELLFFEFVDLAVSEPVLLEPLSEND